VVKFGKVIEKEKPVIGCKEINLYGLSQAFYAIFKLSNSSDIALRGCTTIRIKIGVFTG
jgi:hypothetical protein